MDIKNVFVGNLVRVVGIETRPDEKRHTIFTRYFEPVEDSTTILYQGNDNCYIDLATNKRYRSIYYAKEDEICACDKVLVNICDYFKEASFDDEIDRSDAKMFTKMIRKK